MKRGSNAPTYLARTSGVSRSGSSVTKSTCTRSASGPRPFSTPARSASVVGQTSGHCVKPKKSTSALPRKSARWRTWPRVSGSSSARPYSAPVMSVERNFGRTSPHAAASARLQIMIDEKRSEQGGEVADRVAEGLLGQRVAVRHVQPQRVGNEHAAQRERGAEVDHPAHA